MAYKLYTLPALTITSGVPNALTTDEGLLASSLIVTAKDNNPGPVYLGGDTVSSASGDRLDPGDSVQISADTLRGTNYEIHLSSVFVTSSVAGTAVTIQYLKLK